MTDDEVCVPHVCAQIRSVLEHFDCQAIRQHAPQSSPRNYLVWCVRSFPNLKSPARSEENDDRHCEDRQTFPRPIVALAMTYPGLLSQLKHNLIETHVHNCNSHACRSPGGVTLDDVR